KLFEDAVIAFCFQEITVHPELERTVGILKLRKGGKDYNAALLPAAADIGDQFNAVFSGHFDVGNDHVHASELQQMNRFRSIPCCEYIQRNALNSFQKARDHVNGMILVIDKEHFEFVHRLSLLWY